MPLNPRSTRELKQARVKKCPKLLLTPKRCMSRRLNWARKFLSGKLPKRTRLTNLYPNVNSLLKRPICGKLRKMLLPKPELLNWPDYRTKTGPCNLLEVWLLRNVPCRLSPNWEKLVAKWPLKQCLIFSSKKEWKHKRSTPKLATSMSSQRLTSIETLMQVTFFVLAKRISP